MLDELRRVFRNDIYPTDHCRHPGCGASTREGKPYCSNHIEHCEYIQKVLAEIDRRDNESRVLDSGRWVAQNGHLVREALLILDGGTFTAARLGRMLDITEKAADTLIRMMARKGYVRISFSDTGALSATKRTKEYVA
jgi:hypothetical protein